MTQCATSLALEGGEGSRGRRSRPCSVRCFLLLDEGLQLVHQVA
jgi:hypothetical protein